MSINGSPIKNVEYFKYLGAIISFSEPGTANKEIEQRIAMAITKFSVMKKIICNYHIMLPIRIKFYEVYIRSRLCYCCETWTLTKKQLSKIETAHLGFLRRMIRGGFARRSTDKDIQLAKDLAKLGVEEPLANIDWAYKMNNQQIFNISKSLSMEIYIGQQNIRWVSHVCRNNNDTLTKQLMFPDEKYTRRGFHHRTVYENVIKYHEELGKSEESFLLESIRKQK